MLINKINCINNAQAFKGYYDRVQRLKDCNTWLDRDYWCAEEIIERRMRSEINDLERQIAQKETQLRYRESAERDAKSNHSSILSSKRSRLSRIQSQINYNERTVIPGINRTLSYLGSQGGQLSSANSSARSTLSQQESNIDSLKAETENLKTQNKEFQKSLRQDAEKKIETVKTEFKSKLSLIADNINNSIKKPDSIMKEINTPKPNGFGKISGFTDVKKAIIAAIGQLLVLEKNGKTIDVPNGILLYGPDVNNNSDFANAIARQFNTKSIILTSNGSEAERFNRVKEASIKAKKTFEEGYGRTLIIINKFEEFAPKGSRMIGPLKSFLDNVSKDSHATIIATTETPELLDDILLRSGRFESKIAIPAMAENDILSIIKRYLPLELIDSINLTSLSELIEKAKNGGAYSVNMLKSFIKSFKTPEQIKDLIADIKPEQIQKFRRQIEYIKHI